MRYKNSTDAVLHFLCESGWANDSVGNLPDTAVAAWRITNRPEDVADVNTEFNSLMECIDPKVELTDDLRQSLVGHFIVMVDVKDNYAVVNYDSEKLMLATWVSLETLMVDAYDVK